MKYIIPIARPMIGEQEIKNVTEAVKTGWVSSKGPFVEIFERKFSDYVGDKYGIAVSNGTSALHLALAALGVGHGDEIVVPSLTFVAPAYAVTYTGAKPVFADSHREYWCVDPHDIEARITEKTKAIILVHLYGQPCDIDPVLDIAHRRHLYVIEDCAEAHGAEYKGKKVGSFGHISCFSFYGNKIVTTGEGGMCLTNDEELATKMRIMRDHGMSPTRPYWHEIMGFNYRMTNLQAGLGVAQLQRMEELITIKTRIAQKYRKLLQCEEKIVHAPTMAWARNVCWLYSVLLDADFRDKVGRCLGQQRIETRPFFYPIHLLPPYRCGLRLPVAEELSSRGLSLPSGPVITENEVQFVAENLKKALAESS